MRTYYNAQDVGAPVEEVERLRLIAESCYQAVPTINSIRSGTSLWSATEAPSGTGLISR